MRHFLVSIRNTAVGLILSVTPSVFAEFKSNLPTYYGAAGVGLGDRGEATYLSLDCVRRDLLFEVRRSETWTDTPAPSEADDEAFLVGSVFRGTFGFGAMGVGLSYVHMRMISILDPRPENLSETFFRDTGFGFPLEFQVFFHNEHAGAGLVAFADVRPLESFYGLCLTFQAGSF